MVWERKFKEKAPSSIDKPSLNFKLNLVSLSDEKNDIRSQTNCSPQEIKNWGPRSAFLTGG